jgi:hypothetical protein
MAFRHPLSKYVGGHHGRLRQFTRTAAPTEMTATIIGPYASSCLALFSVEGGLSKHAENKVGRPGKRLLDLAVACFPLRRTFREDVTAITFCRFAHRASAQQDESTHGNAAQAALGWMIRWEASVGRRRMRNSDHETHFCGRVGGGLRRRSYA